MAFNDIIDSVLEAPIVTSFTSIGYSVRRRLDDWRPLTSYDVTGRTMLVTGATSGLGLALARTLLDQNAHVVVLGRNPEKTARIVTDLGAHGTVSMVIADMGEFDDVQAASQQIIAEHPKLDVVIHNAGALSAKRNTNSSGFESTIASQVYGPFLMTSLLMDVLQTGEPGRVITMTSGGMYSQGLSIDGLEMDEQSYDGTKQYAKAKRAQVSLTAEWARRHADGNVRFHAVHPGWADTPGVEAALPTFRKVVGPLLRDAEQGADTTAWLGMDDGVPIDTNGLLWLDRRPRKFHKLKSTRETDTPERREALWDHVGGVVGRETG